MSFCYSSSFCRWQTAIAIVNVPFSQLGHSTTVASDDLCWVAWVNFVGCRIFMRLCHFEYVLQAFDYFRHSASFVHPGWSPRWAPCQLCGFDLMLQLAAYQLLSAADCFDWIAAGRSKVSTSPFAVVLVTGRYFRHCCYAKTSRFRSRWSLLPVSIGKCLSLRDSQNLVTIVRYISLLHLMESAKNWYSRSNQVLSL